MSDTQIEAMCEQLLTSTPSYDNQAPSITLSVPPDPFLLSEERQDNARGMWRGTIQNLRPQHGPGQILVGIGAGL